MRSSTPGTTTTTIPTDLKPPRPPWLRAAFLTDDCIGLNTFASCQYLGFRVHSGSYAQQYAIENAIPYTIY